MQGERRVQGETLRASLSSGGPSSVCLSVCLLARPSLRWGVLLSVCLSAVLAEFLPKDLDGNTRVPAPDIPCLQGLRTQAASI